MTALDDLLALFPDNTSGAISAADLRTAITALWDRVTTVQTRPYDITSSAGPANGKLFISGGWLTPSALEIHNNASDGTATPWGAFDAAGVLLRLDRNDGQGVLRLTTTGAATSQGAYGNVPVQVDSVSGAAPGNAALVTLYILVEV